MSAGGLRPFKPGGGDGGKFRVKGLGRNFSSPTVFNQEHDYKSAEQLAKTWLFPALPPLVSIQGQFRLNGSAAFVGFRTIDRGTIVNEVKIIASASRQPNSPKVTLIMVNGGATPGQHLFGEGVDHTGNVESFDVNHALNAPKAYSAQAKDAAGVLSGLASTGWGIGNKAFWGVGTATGAGITEAFLRGLNQHGTHNTHLGSVTATPTASQYLYYAAPVAWGLKVFEFLSADQTNPEAGLRVRVRTDSEILNGFPQNQAVEYFVIRSLGQGLGGGSPYTFQIGDIG